MQIQKKTLVVAMVFTLAVGAFAGFLVSRTNQSVFADTESEITVDQQTLSDLYMAVFGRPLDDGARFHIGKDLKTVLHDLNSSDERLYYSALFKAVKAYEDAVRAPGDLSATDKQAYIDAINTALSTLIAWVETLPTQSICRGTVGPERAREAILEAYNHMNEDAREHASSGLVNALSHVGGPGNLSLPRIRCTSPSPSPSVSVSPSLSPSVSPSPTTTVSPTTTPTETPNP